jgi:hypothetical protein
LGDGRRFRVVSRERRLLFNGALAQSKLGRVGTRVCRHGRHSIWAGHRHDFLDEPIRGDIGVAVAVGVGVGVGDRTLSGARLSQVRGTPDAQAIMTQS